MRKGVSVEELEAHYKKYYEELKKDGPLPRIELINRWGVGQGLDRFLMGMQNFFPVWEDNGIVGAL